MNKETVTVTKCENVKIHTKNEFFFYKMLFLFLSAHQISYYLNSYNTMMLFIKIKTTE